MDSTTLMTVLKEGVSASILAPNEARARVDLPPVAGGESPLSQQQYYSLEALAERDGPPGTPGPATAPDTIPEPDDPSSDTADTVSADDAAKRLGPLILASFTKALQNA
jgi:hypothetical protein